MTPCMGGWCSKREQCPHHMQADRRNPAERLCVRGRDGVRLSQAGAARVIHIDVFSGQEIERDDACTTTA